MRERPGTRPRHNPENRKPRRKWNSVLTLDEQLIAFCDKWEQDRAAKVAKYRKSAEHWKAKPGTGLVYTFDLRRAEHYEHELAMVAELRRRANLNPASHV